MRVLCSKKSPNKSSRSCAAASGGSNACPNSSNYTPPSFLEFSMKFSSLVRISNKGMVINLILFVCFESCEPSAAWSQCWWRCRGEIETEEA
jgi:hypothetical protein